MTDEQKMELLRELYENTDITKGQYIELCELCEELGLIPHPDDEEPSEPSWDEILNQ